MHDVKSVYWISGAINHNPRFPIKEPIYLKGFAVLSDEQAVEFADSYQWTAIAEEELTYSIDSISDKPTSTIDPKVTGFDSFNWQESDEFFEFIDTDNGLTDVYFDMENGVICFFMFYGD